MKSLIKTLILRNGARLCALAAIVSQIAPYCCRGNYYEPEVPEGIGKLRKDEHLEGNRMKKKFFTLSTIIFVLIGLSSYNNVSASQIKFSAYEKSVIDSAKKVAVDNGKLAADIISNLDVDSEKYNEVVAEVLNKYYTENSIKGDVDSFRKEVDKSSAIVFEWYDEALKERLNADTLDYNTSRVVIQFDDSLSDDIIAKKIGNFGEIISDIKIANNDLSKEQRKRINAVKNSKRNTIVVAEVDKGYTVQRQIDEYEEMGGVVSVEKDIKIDVESDGITNDPNIEKQWHINEMGLNETWELLNKSYPHTSRGIFVAVIDSGLDVNHPDLTNQFIVSRSVDITNNNQLLTESDEPDATSYGHGTHVAGIINAKTNNSIGIAGVGSVKAKGNNSFSNIQLIAIKAADSNGKLSYSSIIESIYYAISQGVSVINMSYGYNSEFPNEGEKTAIKAAYDAGITMVASAGNDNTIEPYYPADYDEVIGVIAVNENLKRRATSNYGVAKDISAPGGNIYSTMINKYGYMSGTSMAAPFVSGVVALMKQEDYNLTPDEIETILEKTATDIGSAGWDEETAAGLINPYAAVSYVINN